MQILRSLLPPKSTTLWLNLSLILIIFFAMATSATGAQTNVLGGPLQPCSLAPLTGFYRNGYCQTGPEDTGTHVVCAEITNEFLRFTRSRGNDVGSIRRLVLYPESLTSITHFVSSKHPVHNSDSLDSKKAIGGVFAQ